MFSRSIVRSFAAKGKKGAAAPKAAPVVTVTRGGIPALVTAVPTLNGDQVTRASLPAWAATLAEPRVTLSQIDPNDETMARKRAKLLRRASITRANAIAKF
jgi:hypothetical protein